MAGVQEYHAVISVANLQMKEVDEPDFIPSEAFKSTLSFEYSRKQLSWKMLRHRENVSLTITWNISDGTIAAANHLDRKHRLLEDEGIMNAFKRSWLRRRQKPTIPARIVIENSTPLNQLLVLSMRLHLVKH